VEGEERRSGFVIEMGQEPEMVEPAMVEQARTVERRHPTEEPRRLEKAVEIVEGRRQKEEAGRVEGFVMVKAAEMEESGTVEEVVTATYLRSWSVQGVHCR
jgi:hypothetical protein